MAAIKAIIRSGEPVQVLLRPDPSSKSVLGLMPGGMALDIADVVTNGSGKWAKISLLVGGAQLYQTSAQTSVYAYIAAELFLDALEPPAPKPVKVGLSDIYNAEAAMRAATLGCRYFSIIGNPSLASQLKDQFPDAIISVRPYLNVHTLPDFSYILNQLEGAKDSRLIYTGINENEQIGADPDSIRKRAAFDIEMANRIKAISGATYAAGTFSMGAPDFTNPDVCAAIQQYYAPAYNSGLIWWDEHLYSPNMQHIYRDDVQAPTWNGQKQVIAEYEWYEARWHFLFTRCGFDPKSSSRVICSETGVDEGGVGGFPAHHATDKDVLMWCKRFMQISALPLTINGTQYPSPFVGGAIFAIGDPVAWAGYDMSSYEQAMGPDIWGKPLVPLANMTQAVAHLQMADLAQQVMSLSKDISKRATAIQNTTNPQTQEQK